MATGQKLMKAIRVFEFGGPEVLKLQADVARPIPKDHQVLIKVHACGVNPVETYIRSGTYNRLPTLPYTPGSDVSGVIEAVGDNVSAFKHIYRNWPETEKINMAPAQDDGQIHAAFYSPACDSLAFAPIANVTNGLYIAEKGDRVFTTSTVSGGYAEYAVAADHTVYSLPEKLDFKQGAAIGIPYFTAYRALFLSARAKAGETVLVHGASGGVGLAACQIARAYGLKVLGTAGSEKGQNTVLQNGAHKVFNHKDVNYIDEIKKSVGDKGIDVIIEMLANINLSNDLKLLSHGGRVIVVGSRGPIEINPRDTMTKESSIIGVSLFSSSTEEFQQSAAALQAGMETGWLKPVIGSQYPLEKVAQAHENIIHGSGTAGKMILLLSD